MAIDLGTAVNFGATPESGNTDCVGMSQNVGVLVYNRNSVRLVAFSVSGTTPTFGSDAVALTSNTSGLSGICRLDDTYGVVQYNNSPSQLTLNKVFSLSGTTITLGTNQNSGTVIPYGDICSMDSSTVVRAGGNGTTVYVRAGSVNTGAKTITWGTQVTKAKTQFIQGVRIDSFNATYGAIGVTNQNLSTPTEEILLYSISGTTITLGNWIELASSGRQRIGDIACLGEDKLIVIYYEYDSVDTYWDVRAKLYSRSGLTLSEDDDILLLENAYDASSIVGSISAFQDSEGRAMIFFTDYLGSQYLLEILSTTGGSLTKELNNLVIESGISINTSAVANRLGGFPTTNSSFMLYNLPTDSNNGYLRVLNVTYGAFVPKVMLI